MKAFPELSYANPAQPRLKRWFIRSIEEMSGRDRFARLYDHWRRDVAPTRADIFTRMLDLIEVGLDVKGAWPPSNLSDAPLVIVANHPFGIGDGIAVLSLAERLGRPFKVLINAELLKISEMEDYSLAIDFSETKEALKNNMEVRHEALRLLKQGTTIVVFPGGGVATATKVLGKAEDLPWKMFPARLIQEARANVIPIHFCGQNGRLFHIVSQPMLNADVRSKAGRALYKLSLTLRTSLLIREFARLSGRRIEARVGRLIRWDELEPIRDRKALTRHLFDAVFAMAGRSKIPA